MPTPSDDTLDISPPTAISVVHATCPPEEERESQRETTPERLQSTPDASLSTNDGSSSSGRASTLDESETDMGATGTMPSPQTPSKHVPAVTEASSERAVTKTCKSRISDATKNNDAGLAHRMSAAAISSSFPPVYPLFASDSKRFVPNSSSSLLRPGSKFHGTQQSDRQTYDVQVEIKQVDMENSHLCGYLRIQGLTDDHPTLTTCFEGEIIGTKYGFKTAHAEWGSTEKVDMQHWSRFPPFRPYQKQARTPGFVFKNFAQKEHLFMRWKEYFLVPDHKVKSITGASFEGFYYICFNQCTGTVSGIYFHSRSEKYQQLELKHVDDRGCVGAMEFR